MSFLASMNQRLRPARIMVHVVFWVALWGFWVFVSRDNHPNLKLNLIASGFLVVTFAAAVYVNHLWLIPRFWRPRRFAAYSAALLVSISLLALACTVAIHLVYDFLWGRDPARFGFMTNYGMEFALVTLHVLVIAIGLRLIPGDARRAFRPIKGKAIKSEARTCDFKSDP